METNAEKPIALEEITIRKIEEKDNKAIAHVIRSTLKEFGASV